MGLREKLLAERKKEYALDTSEINYTFILGDSSFVNPFALNSELIRIANRTVQGCSSQRDKAHALFQWMHEHIEYRGVEKQGYDTALDVYYLRSGICGESTYLYVGLARSVGLEAAFTYVERDYRNKKVHHACAAVQLGRRTLVDVAYQQFDVKHKKYKVLCDREAIALYEQWR